MKDNTKRVLALGFRAMVLAMTAAIAGADSARLSWLEGHWTGEKDGVAMEEHWTSPSGGALLGMHKDVKGGRMVSSSSSASSPLRRRGLSTSRARRGRPSRRSG